MVDIVSGFIPFFSFLIASSSFSILCENRPRIDRQQGLDQPHGTALKVQANTETNWRNSSHSRNLKLKLPRIALETARQGHQTLLIVPISDCARVKLSTRPSLARRIATERTCYIFEDQQPASAHC